MKSAFDGKPPAGRPIHAPFLLVRQVPGFTRDRFPQRLATAVYTDHGIVWLDCVADKVYRLTNARLSNRDFAMLKERIQKDWPRLGPPNPLVPYDLPYFELTYRSESRKLYRWIDWSPASDGSKAVSDLVAYVLDLPTEDRIETAIADPLPILRPWLD